MPSPCPLPVPLPVPRPRTGADGRLRWRRWAALLVLALCSGLGWTAAARAADDPPGRVGWMAWIDGQARLERSDGSQTLEHERESLRNWPLSSGDLFSTGTASRAELGIGSTLLRLDADTQLLLRRIDDEAIELQLLRGSLALQVRQAEVARELRIDTPAARHLPQGIGRWRLDAAAPGRDGHAATAWDGDLRIEQRDASLMLRAGQRAELYGDGGWRLGRPETDDFSRWALTDAGAADRAHAANSPLPPEMTGAERLDAHGDWERHPEWGWIWTPRGVGLGWAPYRDGRWVWVAPWGWTWIDVAPWGFAPFHYGRWVQHHHRWAWVPGEYRARPVYAPALVVWAGAPGVSVSVRIGAGVAWFPLAPREVYLPAYRCTPEHLRRLNHPFVGELRHPERLLERPDLHWRDTRHRHERGPAVSTIEDRGGRDWRVIPWREVLPLPPRLRAPEPPALRLPLPWSDDRRRDERRDDRRDDRRDERRDERRDPRGDRPEPRQPAQPAPAPGRPDRPGHDGVKRLPERSPDPLVTQPGGPGPAGRTPTLPARPLQPTPPFQPPAQTQPGRPDRPAATPPPAASPAPRSTAPAATPREWRREPAPAGREEARPDKPSKEPPRKEPPRQDESQQDKPGRRAPEDRGGGNPREAQR